MNTFQEQDSGITPLPELDLFYTPPTETNIQKKQWVQYRPTSSISEGSPLEFIVPGVGSQYLDLKHTYLTLHMRSLKEDGSLCATAEKLAPVNIPLHSVFNQAELFLNQTLVSSVGVNYAYKSMIDTLLNASSNDAAKSRLECEGFYKDSAGFMDEDDPLEGSNAGLTRRFARQPSSEVGEYRGPLHLDLVDQDRLILNGVETKLVLWPSKESFKFMSVAAEDAKYKMEIVEAILHVCKVTINPSVTAAHIAALELSPALYPYEKSQIKTFEVSSGKSSFDMENVFLGEIPRLLILAMVDSDAYRGSYLKNPYNFKNNDLNWLSVKLDDENVPFQAVKPNFSAASQKFLHSYMNVLDSVSNYNSAWIIDRSSYSKGYTFFVYELLPRDNAQHLPLIKRGNLKIQATFNSNLAENTTVICYGKFPSVMKIDSSRDIIM